MLCMKMKKAVPWTAFLYTPQGYLICSFRKCLWISRCLTDLTKNSLSPSLGFILGSLLGPGESCCRPGLSSWSTARGCCCSVRNSIY
jgi:hypothetical protein